MILKLNSCEKNSWIYMKELEKLSIIWSTIIFSQEVSLKENPYFFYRHNCINFFFSSYCTLLLFVLVTKKHAEWWHWLSPFYFIANIRFTFISYLIQLGDMCFKCCSKHGSYKKVTLVTRLFTYNMVNTYCFHFLKKQWFIFSEYKLLRCW